MIFQHTLDKVLNGTKTQSRRLVKADEELHGGYGNWNYRPAVVRKSYADIPLPHQMTARYQCKWQVGNTYAIQPARGKPSVGRLKVTRLRREDVRTISDDDVKAEGFDTRYQFLLTWCEMHDPVAYKTHMAVINNHASQQDIVGTYNLVSKFVPFLNDQPAHRYDAWVIDFELAEVYP